MFKFIVTAKNRSDIINLMVNTASVDLNKVKWDVKHISRADEDAYCKDWLELDGWVKDKKWDWVDDAIMGADVPTGGMVVVCDENTNPAWGYVCGNGKEWFKVYLPYEVQVAILKMVHPKAHYFVLGCGASNVFETKDEIMKWLEAGLNACEGSEQRRYASMMNQVDAGNTVVDYNA